MPTDEHGALLNSTVGESLKAAEDGVVVPVDTAPVDTTPAPAPSSTTPASTSPDDEAQLVDPVEHVELHFPEAETEGENNG